MNPIVAGNLKSKTSWIGVLLIVLGAIEQSGLLQLIPENYKGLALSIAGALTLVLRNLSNDAISDKVVKDDNQQAG